MDNSIVKTTSSTFKFLKTHKLNEKGKRTLLAATTVFLLGCSVQSAIAGGRTSEGATLTHHETTSKKVAKHSATPRIKKVAKNRSYAELTGDLQPKKRLKLETMTDAHAKFFTKLSKSAVKVGKRYNVYPSIILAQAAIESNYGQSSLAKAPNNNYFGIKGSYKGASVNLPTTEYTPSGVKYSINANFAKYPSSYKSLESNAKLLHYGIEGNPKIYRGAWRSNAKTFYQATKSLGKNYATSPVYAKTLDKVIQVYDLNQFD